MDEINQIAYAEVMQVLKYFDRNLVIKIPIELLEYFKEHQKKDLIVNIDEDDIVNRKNISKRALAILAYIDLEYWCKNEEEKNALKRTYIENESKNQKELSENYEYKDIFKNKINHINEDKVVIEETFMIEYKKDNIFNKLKKFILNIIGKKK